MGGQFQPGGSGQARLQRLAGADCFPPTRRRGARLLPEAQLAEQLHVSRPSLREAIRLLAHEGLLAVKHGVGTFVSKEARVLGPLERMQSMSELIRAAGGQPSHRDLSIELLEPNAHIASELNLPAERG